MSAEAAAPAAEPTEPRINLEVARVVCPLHGEPFRAQWPAGYAIFTVKALQVVMAMPAFERELAERTDDETPQARVEALLDKRPICCWLLPAELLALYEASGIGKRARCVVCRRKAQGTPIKGRNRDGSVTDYAHVCFRCVVRAENARPS